MTAESVPAKLETTKEEITVNEIACPVVLAWTNRNMMATDG